VVDIPNAFIQTRIDNEDDMAIIRIRGELVDILIEIAPETYTSFVNFNHKGDKTLIVRCRNANLRDDGGFTPILQEVY
jgi:hypothetical protein